MVGTPRMASGAATGVTARKAGGTSVVRRSTTLVAPLHAARTAQRAVPTTEDAALGSPLKNYEYCCFFKNGPPTRRDEGAYPSGICD